MQVNRLWIFTRERGRFHPAEVRRPDKYKMWHELRHVGTLPSWSDVPDEHIAVVLKPCCMTRMAGWPPPSPKIVGRRGVWVPHGPIVLLMGPDSQGPPQHKNAFASLIQGLDSSHFRSRRGLWRLSIIRWKDGVCYICPKRIQPRCNAKSYAAETDTGVGKGVVRPRGVSCNMSHLPSRTATNSQRGCTFAGPARVSTSVRSASKSISCSVP